MIKQTTSQLTFANYWDHILARLGYRRNEHRVDPGLYALGNPTADSPVFVTANYTLSFDALRSALAGRDAYILVLDTEGINVWCAAGKGTFGTDELVRRIRATGLKDVVHHRTLILPQLGAAGVAAYEVLRRSGFRVEYGPVRAKDLPHYLRTGLATPEMRRVRFGLADRLVLIPVEVVHVFMPTLLAAVLLYVLGGWTAVAAGVVAVLAGVVVFPILLPWLPTRDFSSKGFILGISVAVAFIWSVLWRNPAVSLGLGLVQSLAYLLPMSAVTAFLALNFTAPRLSLPGAVYGKRSLPMCRPWPGALAWGSP